MKNLFTFAAALVLATFFTAATRAEDKKEEPKAGDTKPLNFGKDEKRFTMQVPANWKEEEPSNNMRMLQVRVPKMKDDPEDAEISAFKMGAAGGVDANIARWTKQFGGEASLKKKRMVKTGVGEATVAEIEGDYHRDELPGRRRRRIEERLQNARRHPHARWRRRNLFQIHRPLQHHRKSQRRLRQSARIPQSRQIS
jgi:hypothetical protein